MKKESLLFIIFLLLFFATYSQPLVTISGIITDKNSKTTLPYVNVVIKTEKDGAFISGTVTNESGRFSLSKIKSGSYVIEVSYLAYTTKKQPLFIGKLTEYLDIKTIEIEQNITTLNEIVVTSKPNEISEKMDKKIFSLKDNISQTGGSVLQAMQNLPSVTVQDGKLQLRGNDKVTVLIDGKQNGLTGFGSQSGLDNIPASGIDRIEII
jgi:hypothetical protein